MFGDSLTAGYGLDDVDDAYPNDASRSVSTTPNSTPEEVVVSGSSVTDIERSSGGGSMPLIILFGFVCLLLQRKREQLMNR